MAQIILTIPDGNLQAMLDGFCLARNFDPAGTLTKAQFLKADLIAYVRQNARQGYISIQTASVAATADANITAVPVT